ncbi:MAG: primosomal protein N' [Prolixibacteraceae bacterium]|nr:primosomal protein N' [Prolixibacteraceae bacterium]
MSGLYAQVLLPLSLDYTYTYKVPPELQDRIGIGQRVVVQFGRKKYYSAIVISLDADQPDLIKIKEIIQILDEEPVVFPENFKLWRWMADYYCCSQGDVLRAALPPGLKLESRSKVFLTDNETECTISEKDQLIINELYQGPISIEKLQQNLGSGFSFKIFNGLLEKGVIQVEEKLVDKYKPKTEIFIGFHPRIKNEEKLIASLDSFKRAKKQKALLIHFCETVDAFGENPDSSVSKRELLKGTDYSAALINALVKKKILTLFKKEISRIEQKEFRQGMFNLLSSSQNQALKEIKAGFSKKQVVLIHGITSSGKTEIYIHLIDEIIRSGKQVLYLVPEISLTPQIEERLQNAFGNKVGIYHSRLNNRERVEIWGKVLNFRKNPEKGFQIILGTRSAIFLPFSNPGLIIVDEEHENSYKQYDSSPRYNARDMAVILGSLNNANVLLGSATPSYESYFNAKTGKYSLVNLSSRYLDTELPEIIIADLKKSRKKRQMRSLLTPELFNLISEALIHREQVILFQNRRGYSSFVQCFDCGWIPMCENCDVSLTYHKYKKELNCHYCGYTIPVPDKCASCGSSEIKTRGSGTEKIEEDLIQLFPGARIDRMDLDTTRLKNAFSKIIKNLETRNTDILVGTQMVTKGLDLEHVSVAGILNADNLTNFPDFRAHERTFQLICQVGGRAGRRNSMGKVVIQTSQPENQLFTLIKQNDYQSLYQMQMAERKLFRYPPWYRFIKLIIKHRNAENVDMAASQLARILRSTSLWTVLGPEYPLVSRIQSLYNKEIWLKIGRNVSVTKAKTIILNSIAEVKSKKECRSSVISIDVDPL